MDRKTEQSIQLPDGRRLAYAEYGQPGGKPIFYFHGNPGSRLEPRAMDLDTLARFDARLIAPDRPGMGLSDLQPGRRMSDWPNDVLVLADALGLQCFALLGVSGGAPYAQVCAAGIPYRLTSAAVVSGMGPLDAPGATRGMGMGRFYLGAARLHPRLAAAFLGMMKTGMQNAKMSEMPGMPPQDLAILAKPEFAGAFLEATNESWRCGTRGTALDATLTARPWDFHLDRIAMPVHLWHGEADRNVPVALARYVARTIPDCRAHFHANEGHLSLLVNHLDEILSALTA